MDTEESALFARLVNLTNGSQLLMSMAGPPPGRMPAILIAHTWVNGVPQRGIFDVQGVLDALGIASTNKPEDILDRLVADEDVPPAFRTKMLGGNPPEQVRQAAEFSTSMGPIVVAAINETRFGGPRLCVHFRGGLGVKSFATSKALEECFAGLSNETLEPILRDREVQADLGKALRPLLAQAPNQPKPVRPSRHPR